MQGRFVRRSRIPRSIVIVLVSVMMAFLIGYSTGWVNRSAASAALVPAAYRSGRYAATNGLVSGNATLFELALNGVIVHDCVLGGHTANNGNVTCTLDPVTSPALVAKCRLWAPNASMLGTPDGLCNITSGSTAYTVSFVNTRR